MRALPISLFLIVGVAGVVQPSNAQKQAAHLGLVSPIYPDGTAPTAAQIALGKDLFFDPVLSVDGTISCSSCHPKASAFGDPRPVSLGIRKRSGKRNAPGLWNVAYFDRLGWDGKHATIEEQTLAAIVNPDEMGLPVREIPQRVNAQYGNRLRDIFKENSAATVSKALAAFQRSLIAGDSPFDQYMYAGDKQALSSAAQRGLKVFLGDARCIQCHFFRSEISHPFGGSSALFTDNRFHNIGIGYKEGSAQPSDLGLFAVTGQDQDMGAFRTPTLRNVALTAPYMHDGSLKTLEDVVDHYNKGGVANKHLSQDVQPLDLSVGEKSDLVEFLKSLTSVRLKRAER